MLPRNQPDGIHIAFDDHRLVNNAGLILPATLALHLGLSQLVDRHLDLGRAPGRANTGDKIMTLVASALAGGDCIDDADALRTGRTACALGCVVKAPSTLGTFLRSFTWGHVRQLDGVSRELLARAWKAGAGPGDAPFTIDLDSTICETYGLAKEGARHHGYTGARGYHPLLAVAAGTGDVLMARLREGRANTARGAAHFLRETVSRVRCGGASGQLTMRADSGFYTHAVVAVCRRMDVRFSITIRQHKSLHNLIEAIPEDAWTPIPYWMDGAADVAETTYTPFQSEPDAAPVRLIVRRVKPAPGSQLALFATYSYHGFITDRDGETLELEADHRRHAEIENAIRDLKYGVGLNHLPWGHVRQLDGVSRELLARAWKAGAGPGDAPFTIDLDSTICETYGLAKEGARHHGYTGARGYHPLLAVAAGTGDVLMARLREGRAITARGAAHFLRETVSRVRCGGASGQLTMRADSGFYTHAVVAVCRRMDVRFSITIRQHKSLHNLIEAIPEDAWTPIPYWMDGAADVAETTYTPFQSEPDAAPVRLIVRRVKPAPGSQLALFATYSYHGFITDRDGETLELEADHRRHAEIENAIRDLKYGVGLNHLPSGRFAANGAWLAVQVMAHNLARWTARIGLGEQIVTTKTLRRRVFALAGRLTRSARRITLHLPKRWPWEEQFSRALARLRAIPLPA